MRDGDRGHWLQYLEWMITTSCDLACPGCDRFIDFDHRWHQDFDKLCQNMNEWSDHLDPDNLTIIGGEPLIHPEIYNILKHARKTFNHARIEVFSNGLLLSKKPKLLKTLLDIQPAKLHITFHNKNPQVRKSIEDNIKKHIFKNYQWRMVHEKLWKFQDVELEISDPTEGGWYDYRQNINGVLKPWKDNNPELSYQNCTANIYPIIYKNRLYKCPPISMLRTHAEKYGLTDDEDWEPYLKYKGLGLDFNESDLEEFIDNINKPHSICNMCPANPKLKPQEEAFVKGNRYEV